MRAVRHVQALMKDGDIVHGIDGGAEEEGREKSS